jgi:ABC-type transport system substrate-binding protein
METDSEVDDYGGSWRSRQISRRQFLGGVGGVTAGVALGSTMAGFPVQAHTRAKLLAKKSSTGWAKAPVSFVFLDSTEPSGLDPSLQNQFDSYHILRNVYDTLTWGNDAPSTPVLEPRLATSWKTNASGLQWTFQIRPHVKFIDGTALDADAVVLSMKRHIAIGAPGLYGYTLDGITNVAATGPMTVTFTTQAPQPWLPYHLLYFAIMSPKAINDHKTATDPWAETFFGQNCVGTGAYKLSSWTHGVKITMVKNQEWWNGPWKPGSIDHVTIQWESDPSTAAELIESGGANFSTEWSVDNATTVGAMEGFSLHKYLVYHIDPVIAFNQSKPPFQIKEVRQAFQYAFDYDAMRKYYRGYAQPTTGVIPAFSPYALKGLPEYKQNIPKAKALLAQANIDPSTLNPTCFSAGGYPDLIAGGTVLASSLAKIGVKVSDQVLPFGSLEAAMGQASSAAPLTSSLYGGSASFDPTAFLSSYLPTSVVQIFEHWNSPQLVTAYNEASSSSNPAKLKAGLDNAQRLINDDAPVILGAIPDVLVVIPDYLEGFVLQTTDAVYPCLFYTMRLHEH